MRMNEVFADTSGWASFFLKNDLHHAEAYSLIEQWKQQSRQVITTNYVLSELIVLLIPILIIILPFFRRLG